MSMTGAVGAGSVAVASYERLISFLTSAVVGDDVDAARAALAVASASL
jgi:hypothetical protein